MNWFGKYNKSTGITYSTRNANLEQALITNSSLVDLALRDVGLSFKYGVPAVVSIHRLNFSGYRSIQNRDMTLSVLREFLDRLLSAHPDVRFSTASELL
jgi:molybdate-binding protein